MNEPRPIDPGPSDPRPSRFDGPAHGHRDRLTLLVYGHLGVWGFFLFSFGPIIPLLRDELDISNAVAGLHASMVAAGSVTASLLYPWLAARLGRGRTAQVGTIGIASGVGVLCSWEALGVTLTGAFLAGGFGSLLVTGSAVILRERHRQAAPAIITEANAIAAGFGLVGPALVGLSAWAGWGWRPVLLGVLLMGVAVAATLGREPVPSPASTAPRGRGRGRLPAAYWGIWVVVAAVIGVESAVIVWSSEQLRVRTDLGDGAATAAVSLVLAGMFLGRLAGGRLARRHDPGGLLLAALFLTGAGFVVFWTATTPWLALAGLGVTGLGMALHYPLAITAAIEAGAAQPELAAGRAAIGGGLAGASMPLAVGALADLTDIQVAFVLVPALLALASVSLIVAGRRPAPIATL